MASWRVSSEVRLFIAFYRLHRFCCVSITAVDGQEYDQKASMDLGALIVIFFGSLLNNLAGRRIHNPPVQGAMGGAGLNIFRLERVLPCCLRQV